MKDAARGWLRTGAQTIIFDDATGRSDKNGHPLGILLSDLGKRPEAEQEHRKALAIFRTVRGEEDPQTANSYTNLAVDLHTQGQYAEAENLDRKALAICLKILGEEHPQSATSLNQANE